MMSTPGSTAAAAPHEQHPPNSLRNSVTFLTISAFHDKDHPDPPRNRWVPPYYVIPGRHRCFVAEIVEKPWNFRLTVRVQDKEGEQCMVNFFDEFSGAAYKREAAPQTTLVIINPHIFRAMDGTIGIRVENHHTANGGVRVLPCRLSQLFQANDLILQRGNSLSCLHCGIDKEEQLKCAGCKMPYCSKVRI